MSRKLMSTMLIAFCLLLAACGSPSTPEPATKEEPVEANLTVLAAASLTNAFTDIGEVFESQHPGVTVLFSFAGSSELATRLAEGAPADVFASANAKQMLNAVDAGRIAGEPVDFLTNSLVVIVPADNPAGIESLADLANEGIRLVSGAQGVPVRDFTEQVLDQAMADPAYGADFKEAVMANVVSEEANVRQLAAKVALGEADAGIVYRSDVTPDIASQVRVIEIAEAINVVAVYPIAVVDDSSYPELAQAFIDFILSDEGQGILEIQGFGPAPV